MIPNGEVKCVATVAKSLHGEGLHAGKLRTLNNAIQGKFMPRVGTICYIWDMVYPGLWSRDGHVFCRSLIPHLDHWLVHKRSRYDYEAPLQIALESIPVDSRSPWSERSWTAAIMAWAITTMSNICRVPAPGDTDADKKRIEDEELAVKIACLMLSRLELAIEHSDRNGPSNAWVYFRARFAVDCAFKTWHETPRKERCHLEDTGRRVYFALCDLLQVHWANVGAVITATAIASRLGWSKEYGHLLSCYATAVGEKKKEDGLEEISSISVRCLFQQMQVQMAKTDGVEVLEPDSDFANFNSYWEERIAREQ